jgi:hypothetical protein
VSAAAASLHDIADVEGFVGATLERSGLRPHLQPAEHEDLVAEGVCVLYELADRYEPHLPGYATAGRFSGFAARLLPNRLTDAWHAWNESHSRITAADGGRRWTYEAPALSLDVDDPPLVLAGETFLEDMPRLGAALRAIEPWQQFAIARMCELVRDGYGRVEVAAMLNVSRERLAAMTERLATALEEVQDEHDT